VEIVYLDLLFESPQIDAIIIWGKGEEAIFKRFKNGVWKRALKEWLTSPPQGGRRGFCSMGKTSCLGEIYARPSVVKSVQRNEAWMVRCTVRSIGPRASLERSSRVSWRTGPKQDWALDVLVKTSGCTEWLPVPTPVRAGVYTDSHQVVRRWTWLMHVKCLHELCNLLY
jgi:hypothetical protein